MKKSSLFQVFLMIGLLVLPVYPARGELYSWRDQNGIENFSNSRDNVPPDAKVQVWTEKNPEPAPEKLNADSPASPEAAPSRPENNLQTRIEPPSNALPSQREPVTQGQFAVQLVAELRLDAEPTPEEAAGLLSEIRVSPPLGRWEMERPITPSLVARLRTLTVSAAERGAISIRPEEALLAFDTTAALLGVPIPAGAPNDPADPYYTTTVVQSPPLVLIAPPPPIYISSYVWVPVQPGFFWGGVWCSGYYVFDVGHRDYWFHRHRFDFPRARIEHHFTEQVVRSRLHGGFPVTPRPPAIDRRTDSRPVAPPPPRDRRLRGGQAVPPSISTPMTPRIGRSTPPPTQMTPLAPRTPMTPLAPATPMTPTTPMAGGRLRGRAMNRPTLGENNAPASPAPPSPGGAPSPSPSLRRG